MTASINYIISRLNSPLHSREMNALYALAATLQKEEAQELYDYLAENTSTFPEDEFCLSLKQDLVEHHLPEIRSPHYRPIGQVITEAQNAKADKTLFEELKRRFEMQAFEDQRLILRLFLARRSADDSYRCWAYSYLEQNWDASFTRGIQQCWLAYQDCASLVVKHLPEEFLLKQLDALGNKSRYKDLCLRLCRNAAFCVDRTRLADEWEYLEVMQRKGEQVDGERLLCEFLLALKNKLTDVDQCVSEMVDAASHIVGEKGLYASLKLIPSVQDFIWGMSRLGFQEQLLRFLLWDQSLRHEHFALLDDEYNAEGMALPPRAYYRLFCDIARARLCGKSIAVNIENFRGFPRVPEL